MDWLHVCNAILLVQIFTGFCSNLGVRGLFSSPFVSYRVHIDWLASGYPMGAGNPTISGETETQVWLPASPGSPTDHTWVYAQMTADGIGHTWKLTHVIRRLGIGRGDSSPASGQVGWKSSSITWLIIQPITSVKCNLNKNCGRPDLDEFSGW